MIHDGSLPCSPLRDNSLENAVSNDRKLIAVIGATGQQGGGVLRALKASGQFEVRALTRDPGKHRALADEAVLADMDRPETLEPAFAELIEGSGGFKSLEPLADFQKLADLGLVEPGELRKSYDTLAREPAYEQFFPVWSALALEAFLRDYDGDNRWRAS